MSVLEAILLGIIQGLTEFLPISSTGHLTIAGNLLGLADPQNPERWTAFIAVIQLGTLAAVFVYFAKEIKEIPKAFIAENIIKRKKLKQQSLYSRLGFFIIIGSVPVAIAGLALKDIIEGALTKDMTVIAVSLIALAILLAIAEKTAKFRKNLDTITWKDSLIVGVAQCFALIPGASRSGVTITGGLFMGMERAAAAKFSFLLSIPAIFASGALQFYQSLEYLGQGQALNLAVATLFSAISGYAAIAFLIKFLKKNSTFVFIIYRIILGIIILMFFAQ